MGLKNMTRILDISVDTLQLSVETSFFPNRAPEIHVVSLDKFEISLFEQAFSARPFGSEKPHDYFLESLSEQGNMFWCSIRISSMGSRHRRRFEISKQTYSGLRRVLDSNIISEGYINE
jgi:hypothetical protein